MILKMFIQGAYTLNNNTYHTQELPEWEDIKFITDDLQRVLDTYDFDDGETPIPVMRVRLARTIAEMRDERGKQEQQQKMAMMDPWYTIKTMTIEVREKLHKAREYQNP